MKESSETISKESTPQNEGETVVLFNFYVLRDPRDNTIKYVGRTVDPKNRLRNHIYEAKKNNRNKRERWIMSLLRKNLKPKMSVIYTLECSLDEAISTEKMLVTKLKARGFKLKNSPDSYLGAVLHGTPVYQYDRKTQKLIGTFHNSNRAYLETGVKDSNILRCCHSPEGYGTKTAGGFYWSFKKYDKYPYDHPKDWRNRKGKPVIVMDLEENVLGDYITARKAAKDLGVSYKKISSCCNGRQKTVAKKYIFKFK